MFMFTKEKCGRNLKCFDKLYIVKYLYKLSLSNIRLSVSKNTKKNDYL